MAVPDAQVYRHHRTGLEGGRRSAYIEFDKAVLALSAGGLALSISFIGELVPSTPPSVLPVLYSSWLLYAICMMSTLLSFLFSQAAFDRELQLIDDHYLRFDNRVHDATNRPAAVVKWLNYVSCAALMVAVALTVVFASFSVF
ncbi:MAG TPA: hypothetical protein VI485_22465 [Vicinamibacterales bacterium]|nr:hypothetical protein [Vicinamibacterales bacterium]